jgi:hypothetical protein
MPEEPDAPDHRAVPPHQRFEGRSLSAAHEALQQLSIGQDYPHEGDCMRHFPRPGLDTTGPAALLPGLPVPLRWPGNGAIRGSFGHQLQVRRGFAGRREPGTGWDASQIVLAVPVAVGENQPMSRTL